MIRSRLVGKELVCVLGCDNLLHYPTQAGVFVCGLHLVTVDTAR